MKWKLSRRILPLISLFRCSLKNSQEKPLPSNSRRVADVSLAAQVPGLNSRCQLHQEQHAVNKPSVALLNPNLNALTHGLNAWNQLGM